MIEIRDAQLLHQALTEKDEDDKRFASRWAWWAPGDFTRYRVAHVVAYPHEFDPLGQAHFLLVSVGGELSTISISRPRDSRLWTPKLFLTAYGESHAGWWAGIRPVLAAFDWTATRADDLAYDSRDANEIGRLLTEV